MRKLLNWLDKYFLQVGVIAFLVFIPLYPKLPLVDIRHTWVYIRLEDALVALVAGFWLIQLLRRKVSLKTPLTFPILAYWLIGGASLLFCLVFLRSRLVDFFPSVAVLHYFRRIEYLIVFFIAFSTIKDPKVVKKYSVAIVVALIGICLYGFGQKFLGLPAFLTMNEEFSKGIPLSLPATARTTSTFGGHYDLAAYLVLMIAFLGSLIFGLKDRLKSIGVFLVTFSAFILLLFTASRISFVAYLLAISLVLFLQKRKWLVIPVVIISFLLMNYVTGASERFGKTFRVERVVYDVKTGLPIATLEEEGRIGEIITEEEEIAGEDLPLGSGYIGLPSKEAPEATQVAIIKKPILTSLKTATKASEIATISGEFLIKRAIVYDISFTTRFQGTWPRAVEAFYRNPFLGSGYSSIGLATDNSFLRALGETGLLGFFAFLGLFFAFFLLIKQGLTKITSSFARSVLIGVGAGLAGLILNAVLIDVFEASKVAFSVWVLMGISVGLISLYLPQRRSLIKEALEAIKLAVFPITALITIGLLIFSPSFNNYFVGDDFTWLRWAATAKVNEVGQFFLSAEGFFYRPLAKLYFFLTHPFFDLKPQGYHWFSFLIHLGTTTGAFLLVLKLTKKRWLAFLAALLFLIHPSGGEAVLWISSTSVILANFFYVFGFLGYLYWREAQGRWQPLFYLLSFLAFVLGLFSHELMVTFPLALLFYDWLFGHFKKLKKEKLSLISYLPFAVSLGNYFWLRNGIAQAHWLSGDYNYSLKNLPFNFIGNLLGYLGELIASFHFIPFYDLARSFLRTHKLVALGLVFFIGGITLWFLIAKKFLKRFKPSKIIIFFSVWLLILLLPFLGLGNIAERYVYLARLGWFVLFALGIEFLYEKMRQKKLGLFLIIFLTIAVLVFYGWEMEKTKKDWYQAGESVNKVLLTLSSNWSEFNPGTTLFFVNLPIRYRRAWLFPVGLEDGAWFIYRDETLIINRLTDLEEALDLAEEMTLVHVLFYEDGELKLATR